MEYDSNKKYFKGSIQNIGPNHISSSINNCNYTKGEIIALSQNDFGIMNGFLTTNTMYTRIGKVTKPENLSEIFRAAYINLEFLLVEEEENETPKENKKSGNWNWNWKTLKILKIVKALKRYRIVKRMKKLKSLEN